MFAKVKPYRSKTYLAWVRQQPCCHCFAEGGVDPHHVTGLNSGMGTKNSDLTCIGLCRICHSLLHAGNLQLDEYYHLARTVQKAGDSGVLAAL